MKSALATSLVLLGALCATPVSASDRIDELFLQALAAWHEAGSGDSSTADALLQTVLERDPGHVEARWYRLSERLSSIGARDTLDRAEGLRALAEEVLAISVEARMRGRPAFAHYVRARYAAYYRNYERALSEIARALALEPGNLLFLWIDGRLAVWSGIWKKDDSAILDGIAAMKRVRQLWEKNESPYLHPRDMEFQLARAHDYLGTPDDEKIIEHYLNAIRLSNPDSVDIAYAWNNVSIAYRRNGECQEAKEAAEKALEVMTFGAAKSNRQFAKLCLDMRAMGLFDDAATSGTVAK